jgi:hypothetical protein
VVNQEVLEIPKRYQMESKGKAIESSMGYKADHGSALIPQIARTFPHMTKKGGNGRSPGKVQCDVAVE